MRTKLILWCKNTIYIMCFHRGVTTISPYSPFIKQDCFDFIFFHLKNFIHTSKINYSLIFYIWNMVWFETDFKRLQTNLSLITELFTVCIMRCIADCNLVQPVVHCQFYSRLAMLIKYLLFITVHNWHWKVIIWSSG